MSLNWQRHAVVSSWIFVSILESLPYCHMGLFYLVYYFKWWFFHFVWKRTLLFLVCCGHFQDLS